MSATAGQKRKREESGDDAQYKAKRQKNQTKSTPQFISDAQKVHGLRYDYSKSLYVNAKTAVEILCLECNKVFWQTPHSHITGGAGCPTCGRQRNQANKLKQQKASDDFVARAKAVHGERRYDYSRTVYVNAKTKVEIGCSACELVFETLPNNHTKRKSGCPRCAGTQKLTTEEFVKRAKEIHGDKYSYSRTYLANMRTKIDVDCQRCGAPMNIMPQSHLRHGGGCGKCSFKAMGEARRKTTDEFVKQAKEVHGHDRYDYSRAEYKGGRERIEIICPKEDHGSFWTMPSSHTSLKTGCPRCNYSHLETAIAKALDKAGIEYEPQWSFPDCKDAKRLRFDFWLPKLKALIEGDGKQHFMAVSFHGHLSDFEGGRRKDLIKNNYCRKKKHHLLRASFSEASGVERHVKEFAQRVQQASDWVCMFVGKEYQGLEWYSVRSDRQEHFVH
jgi:hypothetical protein